jgi:DNA-binding winged helix-turn-helix (wHTH) protein
VLAWRPHPATSRLAETRELRDDAAWGNADLSANVANPPHVGADGSVASGMGLAGRLSFDRFQLDLSAGRLSGQSGAIPLSPKALAVLEYLAARRGRLVTKDELLGAIWPGVFLGDGVLKVCVSEIRRALGDDARQPRIIETAHRRGYRFIAEVFGSSTSEPPAGPPPASPARLPVRYARSGDVDIAYQVLGSGPVDLLLVMGWVSHLEYYWSEPSFARFLNRLARTCGPYWARWARGARSCAGCRRAGPCAACSPRPIRNRRKRWS